MLNSLTIVPAYGRKYATVADAVEAWDNGKDFYIQQMHCYCSIRDALAFRQQMYFVFYKHHDGSRTCFVK